MPETIGFIIVTAIASEAAAGTVVIGSLTVAQIVGTTVVVGGSLALNYALSSNPAGPKPQDGQLVVRQPIPNRRRGYGRIKVGGPLMFSETVIDGTLKRSQVIALHHGEIDTIEEHWLSEFLVDVDAGSGAVTDRYLESGGSPQVKIEFRLGTDSQAAYSSLVSFFPSLWTTAHKGLGIASAQVDTKQPFEQENFTETYPGGLAPAYRAVIRASLVWDPRDGAQDKDTPSTWTWSINPILHALDFHRHADGLGLGVFDDVFFSDAALTEDWIPAANICEEDVGGVPRYQCSGSYELPADEPASVLAAILTTCDGQLYQRSDGAIGIRVGKTIAPTITLDDEHILGYDSLKKGDNVFLACNEVTAKYTSTDHDYQETDADPWRDDDDISARGQTLTKSLNLQWVPNHSQARRLMKLAQRRYNPEWSGTILTDMAGLLAMNERYITVQIPELGIDGPFEITSAPTIAISNSAVTCSIGISSLDQSAFDWNEGTEAGTPPPVPDGVMGAG